MTGMTDISRHGGDKSNRDELNIRVKDDALIDPKLLAATSASATQFDDPVENLVDDSDDDDGYDFGDAEPGFATKVVQTGCKLLFFPLIFLYKGVMSLQHTPWLCGQIWQGIKTGAFFKSLFSPSGWLGKALIVLGTVTGVIWVSRKISQWGASVSEKRKAQRLAREQSAEEAALEREILAEEAAKNSNSATPDSRRNINVNVQPGNGQRKATAVVQFNSQNSQQSNAQSSSDQHAMDQTDDETSTTEGRKKSGFGQLGRFAAAFKRSQKTGSDDTASSDDVVTISSRNTLVDDNDDSFDAIGGHWSAKKKAFFAAACLLLLVGGMTVAKQVMYKDTDVAVNDPAEQTAGQTTDKTDGVQPKSPLPFFDGTSQSGNQSGHQPNPYTLHFNGNNNLPIPPAPNMNVDGMPTQTLPPVSTNPYGFGGTAATQQPGSYFPEDTPNSVNQTDTSTSPQYGTPSSPPERSFALLETPTDPRNGDVANPIAYGQNSQTSAMHIEVDDAPEIIEADNAALLADNRTTMQGTATNLTTDERWSSPDAYPATIYDNSAIAAHSQENVPGNTLGNTDWNANTTTTMLQPENTSVSSGQLGQGLSQSTLAVTPRLQPTLEDDVQPLQPSNGGRYQLQPTAAAPMAEPSLAVMSPTTPPSTMSSVDTTFAAAPSLAEIYNTSQNYPQSRSLADQIEIDVAAPENTGLGNTGLATTPRLTPTGSAAMDQTTTLLHPENSETAWASAPSIPDNQTMTAGVHQPLQVETQSSPGNPAASSTLSLQPLSSEPIGTMGLTDGGPSFSNNTLLQPAAAASQPIVANDASRQRTAQVAAVAPQQPVMPMTISDELQQGIGSTIVSPQQIMTAPMAATNSQNTNYTGPVVAQSDAGTAQYSAQPQPNIVPQNVMQQPTTGTPLVNVATVGMQGNAGGSVYIVQPGDSIYRIAKRELGSARRYREIYDLNRDRLPIGQDTLTAGTELLLPGR